MQKSSANFQVPSEKDKRLKALQIAPAPGDQDALRMMKANATTQTSTSEDTESVSSQL